MGRTLVIQSRPPTIYVDAPSRHGWLHGPLTFFLAIWAIAYPALIILLGSFGPIGLLFGVGAAVVLLVPWLLGLVVLAILRAIA
jgi:hypothetical protein